MLFKSPISLSKLIIAASLFIVTFGNVTFFSNLQTAYPLNSIENSLFTLLLAVFFACIYTILFSLFFFKPLIKTILIITLFATSSMAYFIDTYRVIIDKIMIQNLIHTNLNESLDLLSLEQVLYFIFLGLLPSLLVYKANINTISIRKTISQGLIRILIALSIIGIGVVSMGDYTASFIREKHQLRYYLNPGYALHSSIKLIKSNIKSVHKETMPIGLDAKIEETDADRELVIFVIGETVRADHFSLNGHNKKTNPLLEKEKIINFTNTWSCGTSTIVSVPCMFSKYTRTEFSQDKAKQTENVLDILQRTGANVIWLDNNSDSKNVADRVESLDYRSDSINPICDIECRDEGMLANLQSYIDSHPTGDIFIVLHKMGNHGPAYYKRYPSKFNKFTPICESNQLEKCTIEEVNNVYDNIILYTDYFLHKTISILKKNSAQFETALFYVGDHGESLGEHGLFLHGLPYFVAPDEQKHVPMIMWFGDGFNTDEVNYESLKKRENNEYSHDNVFHTILGLFEVETEEYDKKLNLLIN